MAIIATESMLESMRENCKLPQRAWAQPGRQTVSGAF